MSIQLPSSSLEMRIMNELHTAIQRQVEAIRQDVLAQAQKDFETRVRAVIGNVAINMASYYTLEHTGGHMVLTVKIGQSS